MSKPAPWTPEQREAVRDVLDLWLAGKDPVDEVLVPIEAALADHAPTEPAEPADVLVVGRTLERARVLLDTVRPELDAGPPYRVQHVSAEDYNPTAPKLDGFFARIYVELGVRADLVDAARRHLARTGGVLVPLV